MSFNYYLENHQRCYQLDPKRSYSIGRQPGSDIFLSDPTVSRRHATLTRDGESFRLSDCGSSNGSFVNGVKIKELRLSSQDVLRIGRSEFRFVIKHKDTDSVETTLSPEDSLILEQKIKFLSDEIKDPALRERLGEMHQLLERKNQSMEDLAFRDSLTGLHNRRFFDKTLMQEWQRWLRYKRPFCLIMVDIDHFKKVNDTHGHQKGDSVLRSVSAILEENTRSSDMVCRYGGEEIVIILPETALERAAGTAEKLRTLVSRQIPEIEEIPLTISLGVSQSQSLYTDAHQVLEAADQALYRAKSAGRNRVLLAEQVKK